MKGGWKPPLPTPKPKRKQTPESIKRSQQQKILKPEPIQYDPSVHTTKQQHLWKDFWNIDDTIMDERQQSKGSYKMYIKKQFKDITKMMRVEGKLSATESYTPSSFDNWRKKTRETLTAQQNYYHTCQENAKVQRAKGVKRGDTNYIQLVGAAKQQVWAT